MNKLPPIPNQDLVERLLNHNNVHPGLIFERYFKCWGIDNKKDIVINKPVLPALKEFCDKFNSLRNQSWSQQLLEQIHQRQEGILKGGNGRKLECRMTGSMAIGLGNDHPTENGFLFDRICGVPYLPGTAIKGLCRAWAATCGKEHHVIDMFGSENEPLTRGEVILLSAYPATWPALDVDCICNHHFDYYGTAFTKRGYLKGDYPTPMDVEYPVPIFHLAVKEGTNFIFRIIPINKNSLDILERAEALLAEALQYSGIGARTAVGFGTMEPTKNVAKTWEVKIMKGIIRTFISYSHKDKNEVIDFIAKGAYYGVSPWLDKNDLMPAAGHSLDEEIKRALSADDIAAITLFLSENSWDSKWVKKEIELADEAGKHIIPVILDNSEDVKKRLEEWLRPSNPIFILPNKPEAIKSWVSAILKQAHINMASDVALYLGHRDSALMPSVLPAAWNDMPILDLRNPEFRRDLQMIEDFRSWNPDTEQEYRKIEGAFSFLHRALASIKNVFVAGLTPLGIAGMVGKYWNRGGGDINLTTWNSYEKKEWHVKRENIKGDWTPETSEHLTLSENRTIGEGKNLFIGHFRRPDQFETALLWASQREELDIGRALCLSFPENISEDIASEVAMDCASSFAWARKHYTPGIIYWFAGLPMALMPLVTHLTAATGRIVFMDEHKEAGKFLKAFELN